MSFYIFIVSSVALFYQNYISGKDRLPPSVETMEETPRSHTGDSLLNYFLTMYIDGVEISWLSEVNTRNTLLDAMRGKLLVDTAIFSRHYVLCGLFLEHLCGYWKLQRFSGGTPKGTITEWNSLRVAQSYCSYSSLQEPQCSSGNSQFESNQEGTCWVYVEYK